MTDRKPSAAMLNALAALAITGNVSTVRDSRGTRVVSLDRTRISAATWRVIIDRELVDSQPIQSGSVFRLNEAGQALLNAHRPNRGAAR